MTKTFKALSLLSAITLFGYSAADTELPVFAEADISAVSTLVDLNEGSMPVTVMELPTEMGDISAQSGIAELPTGLADVSAQSGIADLPTGLADVSAQSGVVELPTDLADVSAQNGLADNLSGAIDNLSEYPQLHRQTNNLDDSMLDTLMLAPSDNLLKLKKEKQ